MSNFTENYGLHQWEPTDDFLREDFNEDFAKVDAAIKAVDTKADGLTASKADVSALTALQATVNGKADISALTGLAKLSCGSYTGTGKYGQASPNTLTFPFQPKVVLIVNVFATNGDSHMIAVRGQTNCCNFNTNGNGYNICTWSGNSFTWYSTTNEVVQFNITQNYLYVALG